MTKLLLGMTGSIGILDMPAYLTEFKQHFSDIKIILTYSASQFIPKGTFEIFANGIYTTEFPLSKENMMHVELAQWAELFTIIPATGNVLAQAAHGCADSLLSATILAYDKRVIFFPNMNKNMWLNKALQRNVALLIGDGHLVVNPLDKPSFEYATKQMTVNPVMPSIDSVVSILKLEEEFKHDVNDG